MAADEKIKEWQTHSVVSSTSKDEFMVSQSAGGVVGQMAGVQKRLNLPAGTGVTPVCVTATELAQRRAFGSVRAGVGQDAPLTELVAACHFLIHLTSNWKQPRVVFIQ